MLHAAGLYLQQDSASFGAQATDNGLTRGCGLCIGTACVFSLLCPDHPGHGAGTLQETGARLHGDSGGGLAVEAAADDIGQRGIAQRGHGYAVALVGDGVHLLDELQRREGRVPVHHLV